MMQRMLNAMRVQAALAADGLAHARLGTVSSYDPDNYCAKVRLQPEDIETGWLPIASLWVGPQWGLFSPPPIDAQVVVLFAEADHEAGLILGALWSDAARPLSVPAGELWMQHKEGAYLKLLNGGDVHIVNPSGCELHMQDGGKVYAKAPGGFELEGDTNITGELTVTKDITDNTPGNSVTVKTLRDDYNQHQHTGVQTGAGVTGLTTKPAV